MSDSTVSNSTDRVSRVPDDRTRLYPDRRSEIAAAVANLAVAIATGACTPQPIELEALALICDNHQLPTEAARVRRWLVGMAPRR